MQTPTKMRVAYLISKYPAVSHTFIQREIKALRNLGWEICTFSIRKPKREELVDDEALREAVSTQNLLPIQYTELLKALVWALRTRPLTLLTTMVVAVFPPQSGFRTRLKWAAYFAESIQLAHSLHKSQCDHLHCHFGNSASNTAMLAARLARCTWSMTLHGSELNDIRGNALVEKAQRASFVVFVSANGRARVMLHAPATLWKKFHIVRCGLQIEDWSDGESEHAAQAIVCVARLSHEKAHRILLDSLAILSERDRDFKCLLVGDGPLRSEIDAQIRDLGLADRVGLAGALAPAGVRERLRGAQIAVLSSLTEGLPVSIMEAMAMRCAVVATQVGGVGELVEHNVSGLIVPPGDSIALADALDCLLGSPHQAQELGRAAAKKVRAEFAGDLSAEQLSALFKRTLSGNSTPCEREGAPPPVLR